MKKLAELSESERDLLTRCVLHNPEGCRSADGECGPYERYGTRPCFEIVDISWDDMRVFHHDVWDRQRAEIIPGQPT